MARREGYIKEQVRRLNSGEINRRRFIMTALGAGVTMPTAMSLASRAEAKVPRRGGLLRFGMSSGVASDRLDPGLAANAMMEALQFARANGLVEITPKGALRGELAEDFFTPDGGRRWVFRLRTGISFHDGKPLTQADVIATMEHQRRGTTVAAALLADVVSVGADGDDSVVFELARPDVEFPWLLAEPQLVILASDEGRVDPHDPNGTGGFVLERFEPGQRVALRRNPDYWKADAAHFDAVELIPLPDRVLRQNTVMTGEVDLIDDVDPRTVALLSRVPNVEVLENPAARLCLFPMRMDVGPFANRDLRLALKCAVDRQELVTRALLGHGTAAADAPFAGENLTVRDADLDRAAWHYRASGHSGPLLIGGSDAAFPGAAEAARLIAASARRAGIEMVVEANPDWRASSWRVRRHGVMAAACYRADSPWNETGWSQGGTATRLDALLRDARATEDTASRQELYEAAANLVAAEDGLLLPMKASAIHAHSSALFCPGGAADNRLVERWWFA